MSRRNSGPKRKAEAYAHVKMDEIYAQPGIDNATIRAMLAAAHLAGSRSAARARNAVNLNLGLIDGQTVIIRMLKDRLAELETAKHSCAGCGRTLVLRCPAGNCCA